MALITFSPEKWIHDIFESFDLRLEDFGECAQDIDSHLIAEVADHAASWEKLEPNGETEVMHEYRMIQLQDLFPRMQRYSLVQGLYALFESELRSICYQFREAAPITADPKQSDGKGIRKYQCFMKKELGVEFPDATASWQELQVIGKVRNVICHRDGRIEDDLDLDAFAYIQHSEHLQAGPSSFLQVELSFLNQMTSVIRAFMSALEDASCRRFRELKQMQSRQPPS